uniref:class I SAM-dependent methyltransferase n=1 Tax=Yoonia sp. TaxID=2212373 RepID=UPI00404706DD
MERKSCNVCKSDNIEELLDLGKHPLADTFLSAEDFDVPEVYYPLVLMECKNCSHVFTKFQISPEERYVINDYSYDSSNSPIAENHFQEFATDIVAKYKSFYSNKSPSSALDIGSNVGTLLKYLNIEHNLVVTGVEPSSNIAKIANEQGINTLCALFDKSLVQEKLLVEGSLDVITSTNVVNHMDDLHEMMWVIDRLLTESGMFAFEVPYLVDLVEQTAFDTVYHEHVNYFSLASVKKLLESFNFSIASAESITYMGGSIRIYAVKTDDESKAVMHVEKALRVEEAYFRENLEWQRDFRAKVTNIKIRLLNFLAAIRVDRKRVCCIGAATKGNTLLNYCRLDVDTVAACCDVSKLKVGKKMPGSRIPIIHDDDLIGDWDYGVVLPWNLSGYLLEKFKESGLRLVFPIQGIIINRDGTSENI